MRYRLSRETLMTTASLSKERQEGRNETEVRARILDAAFAAFMKSGYAASSTLEISARARRLQVPADLPVPHDRETLAHLLAFFGAQLVREITDPTVIAVFRLAMDEAVHAPQGAHALDPIGGDTN